MSGWSLRGRGEALIGGPAGTILFRRGLCCVPYRRGWVGGMGAAM